MDGTGIHDSLIDGSGSYVRQTPLKCPRLRGPTAAAGTSLPEWACQRVFCPHVPAIQRIVSLAQHAVMDGQRGDRCSSPAWIDESTPDQADGKFEGIRQRQQQGLQQRRRTSQ